MRLAVWGGFGGLRRLGLVRRKEEGIRDEGITVDFDKVAAFNVGA
jgi:hypothetical protein